MDFLSVEAQLSLQQDNDLFGLFNQSHGFVEGEESVAEQPSEKPVSERKRLKRQSKIPGCSTLSLKHRATIGSGRARFVPVRRQEVAKIRHLGACLRCRSKKIACSEMTPCKPCKRQKLLCHRRELEVRQIEPVPFSLRTVDIFAMGPPKNLEFYKQLIRSHHCLFELNVEWNLRWLFEECISWLCGVTGPSARYSRGGWALSIHTTQRMPESIGNGISELLERITTFDYLNTIRPLKESISAQSQKIEAFVGSQMIQALEGLLEPRALVESPQDQLVGLSIPLLGLLISVGCSNIKTTAWDQNSDSRKAIRRFCEARMQLLRVLIHYLVKIAGRLHNPTQNLCENQLLEQLSSRLADRGGFDWAMPLDKQRPKVIPNNSAQAGEEEKQPYPNLFVNSSEQTVEANNAQLPSLFLPMETMSISPDPFSWESTTEVLQAMQPLEWNPFQPSSEVYCTFCTTLLYSDGSCQSCLDNDVNFNAFVDHSIALQFLSESAAFGPLDHMASAESGEILDLIPPADVEKAKGYTYEGFLSF